MESSKHIEHLSGLNRVKVLREEAVDGVQVLRYNLWFALHCNLLHPRPRGPPPFCSKSPHLVRGVSAMFLSLPANAEYLTFHCDRDFLHLEAVSFRSLNHTEYCDNVDWECDLSPIEAKGWTQVEPSDIVYGLGPDKNTCLMRVSAASQCSPSTVTNVFDSNRVQTPAAPSITSQQSQTRVHPHQRDASIDWDECSTTESLEQIERRTIVVAFNFLATVHHQPEGLYLIDENENEYVHLGKARTVLGTALEQLYARRLFPCLDIAQFKVRGKLTR
eukprot:Blabericola_migrator_1__3269@NODE_1962_length_3492_cov_56_012847_g1093_i1_p2_GENE_NODE_1962_length_3492_cov_56_012847_g1093_i1NODE_1962_length_3492_cov_56_012847_g1093_i1_p2_ORF_typecomplete_len275_score14_22Peptidase_M1_N/PF17900_1/3_5e07_NODE_1962_length_3492_cov_56_012847_g1093_i125843408